MNSKWLIVLSILGILVGVGLFLYGFIFYVWRCFGPVCSGGPPFSYYLDVWIVPWAIIVVSLAMLVFGLKRRAMQIRTARTPEFLSER